MAAREDGAFWLLFERSGNAIMVLDTDRVVLALNPPAERLIGRAKRGVEGTSIADLVVLSEREHASREWERFLRRGEYTGQRKLLRSDGSEVPIEFAAVLSVLEGREVAVYVMTGKAGSERQDAGTAGAGAGALTSREREVVTLIAMGMDTREIAQELHVAPTTVRAHVRNAMGKLGARTRAQLVALALCIEDAVHLPAIR